jgi:hypothetical protein
MSGVCLLDLQKLAEKLRFYITGINSQISLSHAANMEGSYENMKLLWKRSSMKNIIGTFVEI